MEQIADTKEKAPKCCEDTPDNTLEYVCCVPIPEGFQIQSHANPLVMYNAQGIRCVLEACTVDSVEVEDPCHPGEKIKACKGEAIRIRVIGCIKYYVNIMQCYGDHPNDIARPGIGGTICVDQVLCYIDQCDDCEVEVKLKSNKVIDCEACIRPICDNGQVYVPVELEFEFECKKCCKK